MKTVLKELMNGFDAYQLESQNDSITIEKLKEVIIKEYLKKEKEQIMYAYESGEKNIDFPALHGQGKLSDSNKYYDSNFGDKVEEAGI